METFRLARRDDFCLILSEAQKQGYVRKDVDVTADDLLEVPTGKITETGVRANIRVGVQYLEAWLLGNGCVPLYHLMEDAATAEISRAQLWQWIHHEAVLDDGSQITTHQFDEWLMEELEVIKSELGEKRYDAGRFEDASSLFSEMIKKDEFDEFLTLPAYNYIN